MLDNMLTPVLREYLHIDYRRIDSYFEQISDPVKYDKVPVWKIGMKLTGPSAQGGQVRPGRSHTIHEKIDSIVNHLNKKQLLGDGSRLECEWMGDFNLEKRVATQIFIPVKNKSSEELSSIGVWIGLAAG